MKQELNRTLGMYSAITISVGTMIGSAIFVLAGISYETAGPSASLAIFLAGLAAAFTAGSFAELVTFIPTAGGGYAYVKEASDNGLLGFICGWGFWLGYTMSCGLFALGFGTFLNYFFPAVPQLAGAYGLILYVMVTNIKGVRNTGSLQNILTTGLVGLLALYIVYGLFHGEPSYQTPYFPHGLSGTFNAMGFLYITYIGYGLVTTMSEEVVNPEKTIPRAIFISLTAVIFIKSAVFLLGSSIIPWRDLVPAVTGTPLTETAVALAGTAGGRLFAFAGILAMVSSINTAMLASSRTSFAMARDRRLPAIFKHVNPGTKTPIFAILAATAIIFVVTSLRNLTHIATVTSILALAGYSLVNVAVLIFRRKLPEAKRAFRVPFCPVTPVLGVTVNLFLVFQLIRSDLAAALAAFGIMLLGIGYFYLMLPRLEKASKGITTQILPSVNSQYHAGAEKHYTILGLVGNLKTARRIVDLGLVMARSYGGSVTPLHVVNVPEIIPMDSRYALFQDEIGQYEKLLGEISSLESYQSHGREPISVISRDVVPAVRKVIREQDADLIILGWHYSGLATRIRGSVLVRLLEEVSIPVAIYKPGGTKTTRKILYAYGGGYHCQAAITQLKRIAQGYDAAVTFMRVAETGTSPEDRRDMARVMEQGMKDVGLKGDTLVCVCDSVADGVVRESKGYDLVVIGASGGWGLKGYLAGSRADKIMRRIQCGGLVIRGKKTLADNQRLRGLVNRIKRALLP
jgi:amino acid transporter/nucleotide-binding universal stress UspA family protein